RVPYSEAEQFYVALKKLGVPAKVIQYAGMPHGISGSWNQVHRMLNELRWLDTYLKPGKVSERSALSSRGAQRRGTYGASLVAGHCDGDGRSLVAALL